MVNLRIRLASGLSWVYLGVLGLLPFHAFVTTWIGSNLGYLDAWRIWKEIVLLATVPGALWLVWKSPVLRRWLTQEWLSRLIFVYLGLGIVVGLLALAHGQVSGAALAYGLFADLRFVGLLLMVAVVSTQVTVLKRYWQWAVGIPFVVVVLFGLAQLLLPYDFLTHFGYGPHTIPAFQTVDNKLEYQRIQSTLRGANPLGAYLLVGLSLVTAYWLKIRRYHLGFSMVIIFGVACLLVTYSRSAYIGLAISLGVLLVLTVPRRLQKYLLLSGGLLCIIGAASTVLLRDNNLVQNALFHSDETSQSQESSNTGRGRALQQGLYEVVHEPFGRGVGTAGPASTRNSQPPRIAENYFLQVGQEMGWLGLGLFIAICGLVVRSLWRLRADPLALGLLASFVGLTFVNLVSHAWADDTLGLMWWGLAGIAIGSAILKSKQQHKQ
jgi:hypothetical protein